MENDLISRSALKKALLDKSFYPVIVKNALENAPAVDALLIPEEVDGKPIKFIWQKQDGKLVSFAPVVLCKDCKHWNKDALTCDTLPWVNSSEHANWYADDFCSYGERRADDEN